MLSLFRTVLRGGLGLQINLNVNGRPWPELLRSSTASGLAFDPLIARAACSVAARPAGGLVGRIPNIGPTPPKLGEVGVLRGGPERHRDASPLSQQQVLSPLSLPLPLAMCHTPFLTLGAGP